MSRQDNPSVKVADFGTFSHRSYNLGILIPTFVLSQKFLKRFNIRQEKSVSSKGMGVDSTFGSGEGGRGLALGNDKRVIKFKSEDLASPRLNLEPSEISYALTLLLDTIGLTLSSNAPSDIDFGLGYLRGGESGIVSFCFTQRPDVPKGPKGGRAAGRSPRVKRFEGSVVGGGAGVTQKHVKFGASLEVGQGDELNSSKLRNQQQTKKSSPRPNLSLSFNKLHLNENLQTTPRNTSSSKNMTEESLRSWSPVFNKSLRDSVDNVDYGFLLEDDVANTSSSDSDIPPLLDVFARLPCSTITGGTLLTSAR